MPGIKRSGRYKWKMSEEERSKLTGRDLIDIILEYGLMDCEVSVFEEYDEDGVDVIMFCDKNEKRYKALINISKDDNRGPVSVNWYNKETDRTEVQMKGGNYLT